MSGEETKSITESDGKKLWIFWVFGLGFFAGFLVALVFADRLKPGHKEIADSGHHEEAPKAEHKEAVQEDPVHMPASHDGTEEVVMSKAMRDRLMTIDFLALLQDAEIHRYRYEGEMRGIVLAKIRTGSIYEKLGFRDGDIIEHINGLAIADIEKNAGEMKEKLPGADLLEFRVRRDDKIRKIRVRVAGPGDK